jgi:hypothetical protein
MIIGNRRVTKASPEQKRPTDVREYPVEDKTINMKNGVFYVS